MAGADSLSGKVAVVTGSSSGLGADIARGLAAHGADVIVNYRESASAAEGLCLELKNTGVRAVPIQADVTQADQVANLISKAWDVMGCIDILVNNVGPVVRTPFLEVSVSDFDFGMSSNVRSVYLAIQAVGKRMKSRGSGHIINIGAGSAYFRNHTVYGLAKSSLLFLTEATALELAPEVNTNTISPGLIADNEGMGSEFERLSIEATPMNRLVTRAEIAEMVCLLTTPAFDSVTGQNIVMDGGHSIHRIPFGHTEHPDYSK